MMDEEREVARGRWAVPAVGLGLAGLVTVTLVVGLLTAGQAGAQTTRRVCYALATVGSSPTRLVRLDRAADTEVLVGGPRAGVIQALAYDSDDSVLRAVDDAARGPRLGDDQRRHRGLLDGQRSCRDRDRIAGDVTFDTVAGLAQDPDEDRVYAAVRRASAPDVVVALDTDDGSLVTDAFGEDDYLVVDPELDGTARRQIDGLAVDPTADRLYAAISDGTERRLPRHDRRRGRDRQRRRGDRRWRARRGRDSPSARRGPLLATSGPDADDDRNRLLEVDTSDGDVDEDQELEYGNYRSLSCGATAPAGDVRVTKADPTTAATRGRNRTYTVEVDHVAGGDVTGVQVTDTLPRQATYVSSGTDRRCRLAVAKVVRCAIGTVGSDDTVEFPIVVRVDNDATGTLTNTVALAADNDSDADNNRDSDTTTVATPTPTPTPTTIRTPNRVDTGTPPGQGSTLLGPLLAVGGVLLAGSLGGAAAIARLARGGTRRQ